MEGGSSYRPFQAYSAQHALRSNLVHSSEHSIPSLDELLNLQRELITLQNASNTRVQKATLDISTFEGMYRRAKEKEKMLKGKIKIKDKDRERTRDLDSEVQRERGPVVKIKREYSGTPERDEGSVGPSARPQQNGRGRPPNASAAKAAALKAASQAPVIPPQPKVKAKNKRKRLDDDDDDMESIASDLMPPPSQRPRPSPHPHPSHPSSAPAAPPKLKVPAMKPSLSSASLNGAITPHPPSAVASLPSIATDWNLPPKPVFPIKPVGATYGGFTYTKTPNDPKLVMDDFSDRKAPPNQTPVHTFWKEVESWMKPVGEEDAAWLEFDADDVEPFLIPALGRHYTEVWEEEDRQAAILAAEVAQSWPRGYSLDRTYGPVDEPLSAASTNGFALDGPLGDNLALKTKGKEGDGATLASGGEGVSSSSLVPPVLSGMSQAIASWDPRTVTEGDLLKEDKSVGPITERIMGALLLEESHGHHKNKDDDMTSGLTGAGPKVPAPGSKAAAAGNSINTAGELEARVRAELRALGLLGEEEPAFSPPMDDDITSALRRCQSLLQEQRSINIQRKNRLLSIARDRLAYQDYQNTLDSLEKSITAGYTKMLKAAAKAAPKKGKKDKDKPGVPGGTTVAEGDPGVGTGYGGQVVLNPPDSLLEKVRLRQRWVGVFGKSMEEWEKREPGRLTGLPERSIYEGLQGDGGGEVGSKDGDGVGKMDVDGNDPRRLLSVGPVNGSVSQRSPSAFPNGV